MVECQSHGGGANIENPNNFSPQWSQTLLVCHLLQKMEGSPHDRLIVAVWCHWPKPREISMSCLFRDWNSQGIKTSGKSKRELKILCKHQRNCGRERKVGRGSKGIFAGLEGIRMDWFKQCWQMCTYRKKEAILSASTIYIQACVTWHCQCSYLDSFLINEESMMGGAERRKIGVEVFLTPMCLAELAGEGIE